MSTILLGLASMLTAFSASILVSSENGELTLGESLLISLISGIVYAILNIGGKILTSYLTKKGIIDSDTKNSINDSLDDLADDGKINNSNRKNDEKKDEDKEDNEKD